MNREGIISGLRNHPFVVQKIEEGKDFSETYIALEMFKHSDERGQILSIYSSDMQYVKSTSGEKILLKKNKILKN